MNNVDLISLTIIWRVFFAFKFPLEKNMSYVCRGGL